MRPPRRAEHQQQDRCNPVRRGLFYFDQHGFLHGRFFSAPQPAEGRYDMRFLMDMG